MPDVTLKVLSAFALTFLATAQSLLVEVAKAGSGRTSFDTPSAVFVTELLKLLIATGLWLRQKPALEYTGLEALSARSALPFAVPAVLFIAQNNIVFLAMQRLDPPVFQLWACSKLIPVGILARIVLGQRRTGVQWAALCVLALGMATTTLKVGAGEPLASRHASAQQLHGILLLLFNGCLSASSGIANEWLIKFADPRAPLMFKNMQLYVFGVLVAAFAFKPSSVPAFGLIGWLIVVLNALAGLCVSFVLKYADNLIKGFSTSAAVLLAALASTAYFSFQPSRAFNLGALVVCVAFYLYFGEHNKVLAKYDEEQAAILESTVSTEKATLLEDQAEEGKSARAEEGKSTQG